MNTEEEQTGKAPESMVRIIVDFDMKTRQMYITRPASIPLTVKLLADAISEVAVYVEPAAVEDADAVKIAVPESSRPPQIFIPKPL